MKPSFAVISIVGRSGSGKGTQANLLGKKTGFTIIKTGDLLRARATKKDAVGKVVKRALEHDKLMPTPIVFSLWMPLIVKIKNRGKAKGIIFDGNPRKMYEAQMLDELFLMFGWGKNFRVCHIDISEKEARKRMLKRGRPDDTRENIAARMAFFTKEVKPMLSYYRKRGVLVEVSGRGAVEDIHKEITRKLRRFLS